MSGQKAGAVASGAATTSYRGYVARLASAQKSPHAVPPYTRYVNRPVGRRLAALAALGQSTPNRVTFLSLVASFSAMGLICWATPAWWTGLLSGSLMMLGYALDSADGQLARLQGSGGPSGEWLDHVSDQARQTLLHASVLIYLFRFADIPVPLLLVPLGYGVVASTRFLSQLLAEQFRRSGAVATVPEAEDPGAGRRAWFQLPADHGVLCCAFLLTGQPGVFLAAYVVLFVLNSALAAVSLRRRFVELSTASSKRAQAGRRAQIGWRA